VLKNLISALAPLTPFLAEHLYQELRPYGKSVSIMGGVETIWGLKEESVHLTPYPRSGKKVNDELLQSVRLMQQVILLGRRKREEKKIEIKIPLGELKIIHKDGSVLSAIQELEAYIKAELNVKLVSYCQNEDDYIEIYAKPNFKRLGKRLGTRMRNFKKMIEALSRHALEVLEEQNCLVLAEETFSSEDIQVFRRAKEGTDATSNRSIGIELDCQTTPALLREGLARKIVSCLQNFRKDSGLELTDRIRVQFWADSEISLAIEGHKPYIMEETLSVEIIADEVAKKGALFPLGNEKLFLKIAKI
jgi:isoleucyl-tRNA synthetase